jgi:hypothetical protein
MMAAGNGSVAADDGNATAGDGNAAVTVQEAARRTGRSVDAVRSALRRGTLAGFKGNDGEWHVHLPADDRQPGDEPDLATVLRQEADRLRDELQQARDGMEAWRRQAEDGRVTVAELRTRAELLQAALEREVARADGMAAELHAALHRPGWVERLARALRGGAPGESRRG